ncbi:MAG: fibronectin type III domain-containing protein [Anaerovoracaceae bacterium]
MPESTYYHVADNPAHTDAGTCEAELTLADPSRTEWADGTTTETNTISYRIVQATNEWTQQLTAESKDYDGNPANVSAAARFGTVIYHYYDSDMQSLAEAPTAAGKYFVRAAVEGTENCTGLESGCKAFTIGKITVEIPDYEKVFRYDGTVRHPDLTDTDAYTVEMPDSINPDLYDATLKLKDPATHTWTKVSGVSGYELNFAKCPNTRKVIKTTTATSFVKTGLKKGSEYKYQVRAYKKVSGKKDYVATSPLVHAIAGGSSSKYTDAESIKVSPTSMTLSTGTRKTLRVKITRRAAKKRYLVLAHNIYARFRSSDRSVAEVSASGKITAKKAGTCRIYTYTINGLYAVTKVTVK